MKRRRVVLLLVGVCSFAIVGASFRAIPEDKFADPNRLAKSLGVDPGELKKVTHMARQVESDYRHGRDVNQDDFDYLMKTADKGGALAGEIYWNLLPMSESPFNKSILEAATKSAVSVNDSEAFAAIELLHHFGDPNWKKFAHSYRGSDPSLKQLLLDEAGN